MVTHQALPGRSDLRDITEIANDLSSNMKPVVINGCFGWLHTGQDGSACDVAVVICPPLYRDALDSHHSLRLLADEFATAGYPTARFNYPGTGDSQDPDGQELWSAWQQSICDVADWLRIVTGARRLIFCGLRIGATLAALAVERRADAAGAILLAPVIRGHSYLRQLLVEAQLHSGSVPATADGFDFHELHFSPEAMRQIDKVDLRQVQLAPGQTVIVFSQSPSNLVTECARLWSEHNVEVSCKDFGGLDPILHANLRVKDVPADFSAVIDWMRRVAPASPNPSVGSAMVGPAQLSLSGCTEFPLRFGPGNRLFGVLCRPEPARGTIAVVIGNTGRDPHYGSARFAVEFARRLAAEGIASLRMDFEGLGDSVGLPGQERILSPLFETDRSPDISAAIDVLESHGYEQFAVHGLCAGAYHALHAGLTDARVSALLLINMPVFSWRIGDTIDLVRRKTSRLRYNLSKLLQRDPWDRLFRGKLELVGILQAQQERMRERIRSRGLHIAEQFIRAELQSFPRRAMATLSNRHTRTLFLFAPNDGGIDALEQEFGRGGTGLRAFNALMRVEPGFDHMLSGHDMRRVAADLMIEHLQAAQQPLRTGSAVVDR